MIQLFPQKFWFAGAIFFFTAMIQPEMVNVYVPVGLMFLVFSGLPLGKKEDLVMQER